MSHTRGVKPPISLPDAVVDAADADAACTGLPSSEPKPRPRAECADRNDGPQITAQLNTIYAGLSTKLPPDIAAAGRRLLLESEW